MVQKLAPLINPGGSIVFTTPVANARGMPDNAAYGAAKAALRSFARTLKYTKSGPFMLFHSFRNRVSLQLGLRGGGKWIRTPDTLSERAVLGCYCLKAACREVQNRGQQVRIRLLSRVTSKLGGRNGHETGLQNHLWVRRPPEQSPTGSNWVRRMEHSARCRRLFYKPRNPLRALRQNIERL